ncbi:BglG family transcription antiterminator [Peribacillus cavernae]|uniref:BglG family transcription antiterminator n=1 Tax=Peribacillus cavernae TaxID=1674310 RepID=UPI00248212AF|nr:PRD domain-containing protein [Peribacillus cavernae]
MERETPNARVDYILSLFLFSDDYIKLDQLCDMLFKSRTTVNQLMGEVKSILSAYDLSLDKRPNYGVKVIGSEYNHRQCLAEYSIKRDIHNPQTIRNSLFGDLSSEVVSFSFVKEIIWNQLQNANLTMSDRKFENLMVHVYIMLIRIQQGHVIKEYSFDVNNIEATPEYKLIQTCVKEIETQLSVSVSQLETIYLTIHLLGVQCVDSQKEKQIYSDLISKVLQHIKTKMDIDLTGDAELKENLALQKL